VNYPDESGQTGVWRVMPAWLLAQCRCAEIDATTGGCRFCAKGMAYGQGGA